MGVRLGILCCLLVWGIAAQDREEPVYELTAEITPPRVIRQVNPEYSPGSRGVRLSGSVEVETVVSSRGQVTSTRVVKSLDKDVDADVVKAVRQWLFDPARKQKKAVAVRVVIEVEFHPM